MRFYKVIRIFLVLLFLTGYHKVYCQYDYVQDTTLNNKEGDKLRFVDRLFWGGN